MPFEFERTAIPDVLRVRAEIFADPRGRFLETFKVSDFLEHEADIRVQQVNESVSEAHVLRGMHYQLEPHAMGKLVRVIRGSVLDVAIDLRAGSPWFGQHVAMHLDGAAGDLAWIPPGFAHGFCALEDDTHFIYLQTSEYVPEAESGIDPFDPELGIAWPAPPQELLVSPRDLQWPPLAEAEHNFRYGAKPTGP